MYLIRTVFLCVLILSVKSKCTTTYISSCDKISDVSSFGMASWESLIISPDVCNKTGVGNLDEVLEPNFFGNARNLEELYIIDKINGIEPNSFNGLTQLSYIKLYHNQIKLIPENAFSNLLSYAKIDLQHNSIENIVYGSFGNSLINYINLSHNKLRNIQVDNVNLPSLKKLSMKHNVISYIAVGAFHENLEYLNLAHNNLAQFKKGVLEPLRNLKELVLSYNRFKVFAVIYGLPRLKTLDLSHNEIVTISDSTFHHFQDLKNLKLNHNNITHLSYNIFLTGNSVRSLHLHYNAIMQIQNQFRQILHRLEEITISGNPWACACLQIIAAYVNEKNISQPDCDKRYFTMGESAVCVVTGDVCTDFEKLTKEAFENFQNSLSTDLCSDL
ncbi:hypothetical protein RN001_013188 [Aquatica leii]|uniref:Uncharacterized protein n=1 Tax=Aquatica leii TaxID=1421715 RepID=A0AAN7QCX6_9COLE|nr:hypothetical protein RN001_013188 [Aquatica leii]